MKLSYYFANKIAQINTKIIEAITTKNHELVVFRYSFISPCSYQEMKDTVLLYQCGYFTLADEVLHDAFLKVPNFTTRVNFARQYQALVFNETVNSISTNLSYTSDAMYLKNLFNTIFNASDFIKKHQGDNMLIVEVLALFFIANGYLALLDETKQAILLNREKQAAD